MDSTYILLVSIYAVNIMSLIILLIILFLLLKLLKKQGLFHAFIHERNPPAQIQTLSREQTCSKSSLCTQRIESNNDTHKSKPFGVLSMQNEKNNEAYHSLSAGIVQEPAKKGLSAPHLLPDGSNQVFIDSPESVPRSVSYSQNPNNVMVSNVLIKVDAKDLAVKAGDDNGSVKRVRLNGISEYSQVEATQEEAGSVSHLKYIF